MSQPRQDGVWRPTGRIVLPALTLLLLVAVVAGIAGGAAPIAPDRVARILAHALHLAGPGEWTSGEWSIVMDLRVPRAMGAALVGAALAVAGVLLQALLRNPLADPYVVGASGGASLGAVLGMLGAGAAGAAGSVVAAVLPPAGAFAGAVAAVLLVLRLGSAGGRLPMVSVLLAGFAVSTLTGYSVSLLLVLNERLQLHLPAFQAWLMGGISVTGWEKLSVAAGLILSGLAVAPWFVRTLDALAAGEDGAAQLGVPVERDKRRILLLATFLTAAAVSLSGLVGFVGLVVPHAVRLVCGPRHRLLLPAAGLSGAAFLAGADLLARTVLPNGEIPVGIVTAFLGAPVFLTLLGRARREYLE